MDDRIEYLTTDLDLVSAGDLSALVGAFEAAGFACFPVTQGEDGLRHVTIERVTEENEEPEQTIGLMLDTVEALDPAGLRSWDECSTREFNVGYDCGVEPWAFNQGLSNGLLRRLAESGASVRITLYPSEENIGFSCSGAEASPERSGGGLEIDVSTVTTAQELHDLLAAKLAFPASYGRNWDAFWDCVRDPAQSKIPRTLRIVGWFALRETLPREARKFRECLTDLPRERPEMTVEVAGPRE